jgi:hypothetical protein
MYTYIHTSENQEHARNPGKRKRTYTHIRTYIDTYIHQRIRNTRATWQARYTNTVGAVNHQLAEIKSNIAEKTGINLSLTTGGADTFEVRIYGYIYTHICICMYVYMRVYVYVRIYEYVCICAYIWIYSALTTGAVDHFEVCIYVKCVFEHTYVFIQHLLRELWIILRCDLCIDVYSCIHMYLFSAYYWSCGSF